MKHSTKLSFENTCEQLVIVTDSDSTRLVVEEPNGQQFKLYLSSNEEIDILIAMLNKIKE